MEFINSDNGNRTIELGRLAGLELDSGAATLIESHLSYVLEANERVRLTAIKSFSEGLRLHVLDSLMVVPSVLSAPEGAVLDMGSGGGFPGIPIAVTTGRHVTLVDSVAKKMRAIQEYIDQHEALRGLVTTTSARLETPGDWVPECGYSTVVARALSSLPALVELAAPLMSLQAHLICMKGDLTDDELSRGSKAARMVGLTFLSCERYILPEGDEKRAVVVYVRTGNPKIKIPRREGMAQRKPLA